MLELLALLLAGVHFGVPLAYYWHAKRAWLPKPWGLRADEGYRPRVTVILPTYNEARMVRARLDNIYAQDYPRELVELAVVDSASTDGTAEIVEEWALVHGDFCVKLVKEPERRGKARALNAALKHATGEVVVIADADALWPGDALRSAVKWFADPEVGAVSCLKRPTGPGVRGTEEGYRMYYNVLRVAESKAHSTPVFHGELAAFRRELLEKLGGFPVDIGADDSHTATRVAAMGFRAITPEDLWVEEVVPESGYFSWRVRRAQHLIQHFVKSLKVVNQAPGGFRTVLLAESFLHLANPFLLLAAAILLTVSALAARSFPALAILTLGAALLAVRQYRTWVAQQLYLLMGALRNLWTKEIVWSKQAK